MLLSRERFVEQFAIAFGVHCLRHWPKRRKEAPTFLTTCFHERIGTSGGRMAISRADFARLAAPVIEELHRTTPSGGRPDGRVVAEKLYDALDRAEVEVTLKPFEMVSAARSSEPARNRSVPPKA